MKALGGAHNNFQTIATFCELFLHLVTLEQIHKTTQTHFTMIALSLSCVKLKLFFF